MRLMFWLAIAICAALSLTGPALASTTLARDVIMLQYNGAFGGQVTIQVDGETDVVRAGPYEFSMFEAKVKSDGTVIKFGSTIGTMLLMFCDSAAYDLVGAFPYVQFSGSDVLAGNGRLFADATSDAIALDTYKLMSWAYDWALDQRARLDLTDADKQAAAAAAQIYIWELESNAVTGEDFDLEAGKFLIPNEVRRAALMNVDGEIGIDFLLNNAELTLIASVNSPVTRVADCAGFAPDACSDASYVDSLRTGSTNAFTNQFFNISNSSQEFLWQPITDVPVIETASVPEAGVTEVFALSVLLLLAVAYFRPHPSTRR